MSTITEVTNLLNNFLNKSLIEDIARRTGFLKRLRTISPCDFLRCEILTSLKEQVNSLRNVKLTFHGECSLKVSRTAISNKFSPTGVEFFKEATKELFNNKSSTNQFHFLDLPGIKNVIVTDSSELKLGDKLEEIFKGLRNTKSIMKLQTSVDFLQGMLIDLELTPGNCPDQGYKGYLNHVSHNTLIINDLGYYNSESFSEIAKKGGFFLSRYFRSAALYKEKEKKEGDKIDLVQTLSRANSTVVDIPVFLGSDQRFPCRLIALRLSDNEYERRRRNQKRQGKRNLRITQESPTELDKWSILVTNLRTEQLSAEKAWEVYACRWQIELFFKLLKSECNLANFTHQNPLRIQIEVYIKYIAVWVIMMIVMTITEKEISLSKAVSVFRQFGSKLFVKTYDALYVAIEEIVDFLIIHAAKDVRRKRLTSKQKIGWGPIETKAGEQKNA
jgi:Transposase DDE domain